MVPRFYFPLTCFDSGPDKSSSTTGTQPFVGLEDGVGEHGLCIPKVPMLAGGMVLNGLF